MAAPNLRGPDKGPQGVAPPPGAWLTCVKPCSKGRESEAESLGISMWNERFKSKLVAQAWVDELYVPPGAAKNTLSCILRIRGTSRLPWESARSGG